MTDNVEETAEVQAEDTANNAEGNEAEAEIVEDDPMIIEANEAQAEIDAAAKAEEGKTEAPEADKAKGAEAEPEPEPDAAKETPMIPKARFDQKVSEANRFKDTSVYLQGIVDTQNEMLKGMKPGEDGKTTQAEPDTPVFEDVIAKAEDDKLEIAQKYEDGEISYKESQQQIIELDRSIRKQINLQGEAREAQFDEKIEQAKQTANDTVSESNMANRVGQEAVKIQEKHPYVAEIDNLPEAIKKGVWQEIGNEAVAALAEKGIDPNDGTLASRLAYMQEKAALTDKYGPQYTGKTLSTASQEETKNEPGKLSETAQNRSDKIDLAQTQPPGLPGGVSDKTADLTEADLENMDQDQMADFLEKAPDIVQKAAGLGNR